MGSDGGRARSAPARSGRHVQDVSSGSKKLLSAQMRAARMQKRCHAQTIYSKLLKQGKNTGVLACGGKQARGGTRSGMREGDVAHQATHLDFMLNGDHGSSSVVEIDDEEEPVSELVSSGIEPGKKVTWAAQTVVGFRMGEEEMRLRTPLAVHE